MSFLRFLLRRSRKQESPPDPSIQFPASSDPDILVSCELRPDEAEAAKDWYRDSNHQERFFVGPPPEYTLFMSEMIASMQPESVLEFGCNAGRNLGLLRTYLPAARLVGVDVNEAAINAGKEKFDFALHVADENWLPSQPTDSFDVVFTISVLDHIPDVRPTGAEIARVCRRYVALLEIHHHSPGKVQQMRAPDGSPVPGYPYSYFHDYRAYFERELGWACVIDAHLPVGDGDLLETYRLNVFAPQADVFAKILTNPIRFK
jgi:SAM-dependent methyltransferase